MVRDASRLLGAWSFGRDVCYTFDVRSWSDSSAAVDISQRRGCGGVRHVEPQRAIKDKKFLVNSVLEKLNMSDICTKHVEEQ